MAGFSQRSTGPVDLRVVSYPAVTVFVDLGGGLVVDDAGGQRTRGSVVAGLEPGGIRGGGRDVECLQVRLSPVVAYAALGAPSALGSGVVTFDDLWGREAMRIQDRLEAACSWDDRFAIAAAALARRCEAGRTVDPAVSFAWRQLVASRGRVRVASLAAEIGWSRKRLWDRFRLQIGLTPKRAAQLIRFDHAIHHLAAGRGAALAAAMGGYVDQSHLHRDVMTFAGTTPAAVAVAPWLAVDDVAWAAPEHVFDT